jgi:exosortase family protein XrtM
VKEFPQETSRSQVVGTKPATNRHLYWRLFAFLAIFVALQSLYDAAKGTWIERFVIDQATVKTAAWFINTLDLSVNVAAIGTRLRAPGGGINIINGCEGTDVLFLMIAAMLIAPLSLKGRLSGIAVGIAFVFLLNQVRIIALFYSFRADKAFFEMLHGVVAPLLLIVATAAFFMYWLGKQTSAIVAKAKA